MCNETDHANPIGWVCSLNLKPGGGSIALDESQGWVGPPSREVAGMQGGGWVEAQIRISKSMRNFAQAAAGPDGRVKDHSLINKVPMNEVQARVYLL